MNKWADWDDQTRTALLFALGFLLIIALGVGGWVFSAAMEARAYNRATGQNVTTWDAMWVELRVVSRPKGND